MEPITPPLLGDNLGVIKIGQQNIGTFLIGEETIISWFIGRLPETALVTPKSPATLALALVPANPEVLP
jgi:hypothetical protein